MRMDFCRTELLPSSFDIIAVSKTWFHPAFTDSMAEIKGYSLVRNDRQGRSSGGVALYIKSNLSYKILSASKETGVDKLPEYLICEVSFSNTQIMVAVVYRPPDHLLSHNMDFLDIILSFSLNYSSKIILGDFNVNMLYFHRQSTLLFDFLIHNNLYLIPHGETHHGPLSNSFIDLMITDENDKILSFDKKLFINNHYLTHATTDIFTPHSPETTLTFRNMKSINPEEFTIRLRQFDWSFAFRSLDIDHIWDTTAKNITSVLDSTAPFKTFKITKKSLPWLTPELKHESRHLDYLYCRYKRKRIEPRLDAYRDFRDSLNEKSQQQKLIFSQINCPQIIPQP